MAYKFKGQIAALYVAGNPADGLSLPE